MSAGRVVEEGSHDQLMAAGRVYADMWQMQQDQELQQERVCVAPEHWEDFEACAGVIGAA